MPPFRDSLALFLYSTVKLPDIDAGLRAYERFKGMLGLREKLRFTLTRVKHGLGDFDSIP